MRPADSQRHSTFFPREVECQREQDLPVVGPRSLGGLQRDEPGTEGS